MVVNTNIRGGKTDKKIDNYIELKSEVDQEGNIYNTLTLSRTHNGGEDELLENLNNVDYIRFYVPEGSELILADNFDTVPVSEFKIAMDGQDPEEDFDLSEIEQNPIIDERSGTRITQEFGKTCFANWLMVDPGKTKVVTIKYKLPFKFSEVTDKKSLLATWFDNMTGKEEEQTRTNYSLLIQKQAGDMQTNFTHTLSLSDDWQVIDQYTNSDINLNLSTHQINFTGNLGEDRYMGIILEK
jgi:hypothetical protein